jgi:DNA-binding TFAR19-related protein (PDSD5 family)
MTKAIQVTLQHSPTLNTVIMVEETIKGAEDSVITIAQIKRMLPKQVNHNTLKTILAYLEESNKIAVSIKGITWIHNPNGNLKKAVARGMEL